MIRRILTRCSVCRLLVVVDFNRRTVAVEPDEMDLHDAGAADLLAAWSLVGRWAAAFRVAFPGWRVNGFDLTPPDQRCLKQRLSPDGTPTGWESSGSMASGTPVSTSTAASPATSGASGTR